MYHILGQHFGYALIQGGFMWGNGEHVQLAGDPGVYNQLQQTTNNTSTADPVPWVPSELHFNKAAPSTREGLDHHSELPLANKTANHYNPPTIPIARKDDSSSSSSLINPNTM